DDFINDEEDIPHDLAYSEDEVLANSDDEDEAATMSVAVVRDCGGDGACDLPRPPSRQTGLGCRATRRGGKDGGRKRVRKETRNIDLKRAVKRYDGIRSTLNGRIKNNASYRIKRGVMESDENH
nr:hypothetical protein [Tanacetum cinerariifolium]